jgi:hypothetical protein
MGGLRGGTGGGLFYGDFEGYVKEDSGDGHLFPWGPRWGKLEGGLLHQGL